MSISDIYDNEFRKRNKDHFAAIVRLALIDDVITEDEQKFLNRLADNLNISKEDYKKIMKDYASHPINPPVSYDHRLERLYDLARMVHVDHIKGDHEEILLRKIGVGLGFHPENVKYIVDKALTLVANGVDLETFIYEIRHMNE